MCPWRMDFSRADWAEMALRGRETSIRRLGILSFQFILLA
jgi:hypothetical protein